MPNTHSSISFGLVNIPIIMNPVIRNNDTSFNQLHKKCLNRVSYIKYCEHCNEKLKESDIIKGYEYDRDKYITFKKEELDKLKPENEKEIEIVSFIDIKEIDPSYFEKSYIIETEKSSKPYNLFYEALKKTKKVALAKTVIGSKFYYCILRLTLNGIVMTTLFFKEEVTLPDNIKETKINDKELDLAIKLIEERTSKFDPSKLEDEYQNNIKNAINDKLNGKTIKGKKKEKKTQVNDLLEALEKSLKKKK